jgi:plastocyanin
MSVKRRSVSMNRVAFLVAFVALLTLPALAVAATSPSLTAPVSPRGATQIDGSVTIVDLAFQPSALVIGAGSIVTWSNAGALPHTVSSDTGAFDSGILRAGGSFSTSFAAPGLYAYHCLIHPAMLGTVQVT